MEDEELKKKIEQEEMGIEEEEEKQQEGEDEEKVDLEMFSDNEDGGEYVSDGGEGDGARQLDEDMLNELLLICSNIATIVDEEGERTVVRSPDCVEWVHDLQRAIRRDDARFRLVALKLGQWKILQKKLLPLLMNHRNDWELVFSILKVIVMLTMKPPRDSKQLSRQFLYLRTYKGAFLDGEIIHFLISILADPLSREGRERTDGDYLIMELILTLLRNLLAVPNDNVSGATSENEYMTHLQQDMIVLFHEENVFDVLLLLAQDIKSKESREWNLLLMEMFELVVRTTTPDAAIDYLTEHDEYELCVSESLALDQTAPKSIPTKKTGLLSRLADESNQRARTARHSNFGGMLSIQGPSGQNRLITDLKKPMDQQVPQAHRKGRRKTRRKKNMQMNDLSDVFGSSTPSVTQSEDPRSRKVLKAVFEICNSMFEKSYTQLTESLKTEFERGSAKLLPTDRVQYFYLIWFLTRYHRLKQNYSEKFAKKKRRRYEELRSKVMDKKGPEAALQLPMPEPFKGFEVTDILSTLDIFSFNFVLSSIETYIEQKNYTALLTGVRLLTEMMSVLVDMGRTETSREIAHAIQERIFFEREFLERLPALFKIFAPDVLPLSYAIQVVTLTHFVLKLLDQGDIRVRVRRKDNLVKETSLNVRRYVLSLITYENIQLYTMVLAKYKTNGTKVNHFVHSFFHRVQFFQLPDEQLFSIDEDRIPTLEPILYNINLLLLYNTILNDRSISSKVEFQPLIKWIRGIVKNYFTLAQTNRLVFVESLLRHSYMKRICPAIQRAYVREYMSAPKSKAKLDSGSRMVQDDFEDEEEFEATGEIRAVTEPTAAITKRKVKRWKKIDDRFLKRKYEECKDQLDVLASQLRRSVQDVRERIGYLKLDLSDQSSDDDQSIDLTLSRKTDGNDLFSETDDDEEETSKKQGDEMIQVKKRRKLDKTDLFSESESSEDDETEQPEEEQVIA